MAYYLRCPIEHGYPRFVVMTFMNKDYTADPHRPDFIPAMQNGMGIISYLKYYAYTGKKNPKVLQFARYMGDYLVNDSLTPDAGKYPRFPRSTGISERYPQPEDAGSQKDRPYEIQPDKAAIAAYALTLLYQETGDTKYRDLAVHVGKVLADNMGRGSPAFPGLPSYRQTTRGIFFSLLSSHIQPPFPPTRTDRNFQLRAEAAYSRNPFFNIKPTHSSA